MLHHIAIKGALTFLALLAWIAIQIGLRYGLPQDMMCIGWPINLGLLVSTIVVIWS